MLRSKYDVTMGGWGDGETVLIGQLFCYFSVRYWIDSLRKAIFKNRMRNVAIFPKNESKCKQKKRCKKKDLR